MEPQQKDDERRHADRPTEPGMGREPGGQAGEYGFSDDHVLICPDVARHLNGDVGAVGIVGRIGKADQVAHAKRWTEVAGIEVPEDYAERGPQGGSDDEKQWLRE